MNERFLEFCLNESVRVAHFAAKLYEVGQHERAQQLREIADSLGRLAHAQERAA